MLWWPQFELGPVIAIFAGVALYMLATLVRRRVGPRAEWLTRACYAATLLIVGFAAWTTVNGGGAVFADRVLTQPGEPWATAKVRRLSSVVGVQTGCSSDHPYRGGPTDRLAVDLIFADNDGVALDLGRQTTASWTTWLDGVEQVLAKVPAPRRRLQVSAPTEAMGWRCLDHFHDVMTPSEYIRMLEILQLTPEEHRETGL